MTSHYVNLTYSKNSFLFLLLKLFILYFEFWTANFILILSSPSGLLKDGHYALFWSSSLCECLVHSRSSKKCFLNFGFCPWWAQKVRERLVWDCSTRCLSWSFVNMLCVLLTFPTTTSSVLPSLFLGFFKPLFLSFWRHSSLPYIFLIFSSQLPSFLVRLATTSSIPDLIVLHSPH